MSLHATLIAFDGIGVLLCGPSGSGKSDLALRCLDLGARLVADDRVVLDIQNGVLIGRCPKALQGLLEVRGIGIARVPALAEGAIGYVIDLVQTAPERMPDPEHWVHGGISTPLYRLLAFEAATPHKIKALAFGLFADATSR